MTYPKAPLGNRFLAVLVDSIIAAPIWAPLGIVLLYADAFAGRFPVLGILLIAVGALWSITYSLGRDVRGGAGFGKRLLGLVVVSADTGQPLGGGPTVIRQLILCALNLVPGVGTLVEPVMVVFEPEGRRLGDRVAGTQVARSADVAARGYAVPAGKGLAIAVLVATIVLSTVGGGLATVYLLRTAGDYSFRFERMFPDSYSNDGYDSQSDPQSSPVQPADPPASPGGTLTQESAVGAVTGLLSALQDEDAATARTYVTDAFASDYAYVLEAGVPLQFEVLQVIPEADAFVVLVREEWPLGEEHIYYFVTLEDGAAKIDGLAYQDEL